MNDTVECSLPWYVITVQPGFEGKVKLALLERIRASALKDCFGEVCVPEETMEQEVNGKKKMVAKRFLPRYVLVQMDMSPDTWHLVKQTPKVLGFVGNDRDPIPLTEEEILSLRRQMEEGTSIKPEKEDFELDVEVEVKEGPFQGFSGRISEIKGDILVVLLSVFGRPTPVELGCEQVERLPSSDG